ncbi:thiazole synthase [Gynuella sunshinyii]|uniref:Thiazole synthase n=1 Tax=Gynuella sunshinyii YC6258 TaxID=1445510 RepID=A0A0C5VT24_9GAMM|nr:thiazole synthase [Gynuella sunshinyii]AJQ97812.1 putative enzyme of thiazole biosynthesis [Gynuella sunshinyii YC6258]
MWQLADKTLDSHLLIGTARYPSPEIMIDAIRASGAQVATISIKRQNPRERGGDQFWQLLSQLKLHLLPNTAHCYSAREAIETAMIARELFDTHWIKLEVLGSEYQLNPDPFALVEAAKELIAQGFEVFPYCTDDLALAERLVNLGCRILMPWAAPIGTGKGLLNPYALTMLRQRFADITLIVDAGIGVPSHAAQAMELGYDGILLNTAVAQSHDPITMANAFAHGIEAGRLARTAGPMAEQDVAHPSTPAIDRPFWHQEP